MRILQSKVEPALFINHVDLDNLPLFNLESGQKGIVVEISGGKQFLHRLLALGFSPGVEVTVLQNRGKGPILTKVRDSRIALGRGESQNIWVQPCPQ